MKIFHCDHCDRLVFFENSNCVKCGHILAYMPDREDMGTLEQDSEDRSVYRVSKPDFGTRKWFWSTSPAVQQMPAYRLCANYSQNQVCNWAVPVSDPNPFCLSCRLTRLIPDLSKSGNREAWEKLEAAKRRLVYSLVSFGLPLQSKTDDPERGLAFEFLADPEPGSGDAKPVLTGHADGLITINVAEADDAERERRRHQMGEEYRTLLGHFRHEVGHYYWDRLVRDSSKLEAFRNLFGDERRDYGDALRRHHSQGAPAGWEFSHVSAYASAHPWEDWAETWAHYLHIGDTLETAVECGLSLQPKRAGEPTLTPDIAVVGTKTPPFEELIERWYPLTYVLNNLNRGMGMQDAYPFVLSNPAVNKLRFVHEIINGAE